MREGAAQRKRSPPAGSRSIEFKTGNYMKMASRKRKAGASKGGGEKKRARAMVETRLQLNTGETIPVVQLGTYRLKGDDCKRACQTALKLGYEGLDTAHIYGNEKEVGKAVSDAIKRSAVFVQVGGLIVVVAQGETDR